MRSFVPFPYKNLVYKIPKKGTKFAKMFENAQNSLFRPSNLTGNRSFRGTGFAKPSENARFVSVCFVPSYTVSCFRSFFTDGRPAVRERTVSASRARVIGRPNMARSM